MANTASRLSANGSLTISGSFDEITRISANGLILYYDAGKSYPTGYGTTLNDLSSSNNTGILINGPVYNSANSGYFNLSGYNYIASSIQYLGPNEFTIGVWFRTSTTGVGNKLIGFSNGQYGNFLLGAYDPLTYETNYDRHLYVGSDNKVYFGIYPNQVVTLNTSGTYTDNVWHYAVGTFSGSQSLMRLYVDGVLIGSNTQFSSAQAYYGSWKIGGGSISGWPSNSNYFLFPGAIGPAEVYSRALTSDEVLQNYNVDAARFGRTPTAYTSSKTTANAVYITGEFNEIDYNQNNSSPNKNVFQWSQDFSKGGWSIYNFTLTQNAEVAPDGTRTASLFTGAGLYNNLRYHNAGYAYIGGGGFREGETWTQSIFVKYGTQRYVTFVAEDWNFTAINGVNYNWVTTFDLLTGQVSGGGVPIVNQGMTNVGNGWWRIWITFRVPAVVGFSYQTLQFRPGAYDGTDYTGKLTYVWGAQLERGASPTEYVGTGAPKNLLVFSEDYTQDMINGYRWNPLNNVTVTKGSILDPNGNFNGSLISSTINGGNNNCFVNQQLYDVTPNTNYTFSVYLKQGTSPTSLINFYSVSPFYQLSGLITWPTIPGRLPTLTQEQGTPIATSITPAPNGWYRFSMSLTNNASTSMVCRVYVRTQSTTNVIGDTVYMWGAQMELGTTPTTYIRNDSFYSVNLPLAPAAMKTTNTGNTFIKDTFDEVTGNISNTDNLIGYYDTAKPASYSGTGSTWFDLSSSCNHATLNSSPTFSTDTVGYNYFNFDGINNTGNIPNFNLQQNFTLECWVKHQRVNGFAFFGHGTTSPNLGLHIWFNNSDSIRIGMYANDTDFYGLSTNVNQWYHYVFTYQNSAPWTKQAFRNGVVLTPTIVSGPNQYGGSGPLRIGGIYGFGTTLGYGQFGHVKIYNKVLSQAEVTQNFNELRGRYGV